MLLIKQLCRGLHKRILNEQGSVLLYSTISIFALSSLFLLLAHQNTTEESYLQNKQLQEKRLQLVADAGGEYIIHKIKEALLLKDYPITTTIDGTWILPKNTELISIADVEEVLDGGMALDAVSSFYINSSSLVFISEDYNNELSPLTEDQMLPFRTSIYVSFEVRPRLSDFEPKVPKSLTVKMGIGIEIDAKDGTGVVTLL